jgi:hypothetical protein
MSGRVIIAYNILFNGVEYLPNAYNGKQYSPGSSEYWIVELSLTNESSAPITSNSQWGIGLQSKTTYTIGAPDYFFDSFEGVGPGETGQIALCFEEPRGLTPNKYQIVLSTVAGVPVSYGKYNLYGNLVNTSDLAEIYDWNLQEVTKIETHSFWLLTFIHKSIWFTIILLLAVALAVWLFVKYFRNKKREADFLIIRRRNQQATQKRQEEQELIDQKEREERELITSEIDKYLHKALQIMDTTAKWYNNEDEANRELVSVLKAQNIDAMYLHRLSNGRTADAKVGNVLIEGKLSPDTSEIDRLIGQISDYVQYSEGNKINIVIYGELNEEGRRRIEREILQRYLGKVFLSYLDNPQRLRKL